MHMYTHTHTHVHRTHTYHTPYDAPPQCPSQFLFWMLSPRWWNCFRGYRAFNGWGLADRSGSVRAGFVTIQPLAAPWPSGFEELPLPAPIHDPAAGHFSICVVIGNSITVFHFFFVAQNLWGWLQNLRLNQQRSFNPARSPSLLAQS